MTIPHSTSQKEALSENSPTLKAGQVIRTIKTGTTMNPVSLEDQDKLNKQEIHIETTGVILRVEKTKYYEYQEIRDFSSDKVQKQVLLKWIPSFKKSDKQTAQSKQTIDLGNNYKVKFKQDLVSITNTSFCDTTLETEELAVVYREGIQQFSDYATTFERSSCEGNYSTSDLRALSLSEIKFCDMTAEVVKCGLYNLNAFKP